MYILKCNKDKSHVFDISHWPKIYDRGYYCPVCGNLDNEVEKVVFHINESGEIMAGDQGIDSYPDNLHMFDKFCDIFASKVNGHDSDMINDRFPFDVHGLDGQLLLWGNAYNNYIEENM